MSADLEFCLLQPGIAMRWALDETKLRTISGRREMYVDGQRNYLLAK